MIENNNVNDQVMSKFDLGCLLWQEKKVVFYSISIWLCIALAYIQFMKPLWTAKIYISFPHREEVKAFIDWKKQYALIMGLDTDINEQVSQELFENYLQLLTSPEEQKQFFRQRSYIQEKLLSFKQEKEKRSWLNQFIIKNLLISEPESKKHNDYYMLKLKTDAPSQSNALLQQLLAETNKKAIEHASYEFKDQIKAQILMLEQEKKSIEAEVSINKENEIKLVYRAFEVAKKADIVDFFGNYHDVKYEAKWDKFLLGEKLVVIELENLKNSVLIYPYHYHRLVKQLTDLKNLLNYQLSDSKFFHVKLESLASSEGLSATMILLLGAIIGLITSIIFISITSRWKTYDKNYAKLYAVASDFNI